MQIRTNYVELDLYEQHVANRSQFVALNNIPELAADFGIALQRLQTDFGRRALASCQADKGNMAGLAEQINYMLGAVDRIGMIAVGMFRSEMIDRATDTSRN